MQVLTLAVVLAAASTSVAEPMGPPARPDRAEVLRRSFPDFVPEADVAARMRTSKAVSWSLSACDAVSAFTSKGEEAWNPLAFGSKSVGVGFSLLSTVGSLKAEEVLSRAKRKGWADGVRYTRWILSAAACGWNVRLSF